jgi:hypothetical protein
VERGFWQSDGRPSPAAVDLVEGRGSGLSHGEAVLVRIAMDLWNGHGGASFDDVLHVLDAERTRTVVTLLLAANDSVEAVDAWLKVHETTRGRLPIGVSDATNGGP